MVDDLGPLVVPVDYLLDEGTVVLRTDEGTKLDAALRGETVAFEIDVVDDTKGTGWSVLVRGRAVEVCNPAELERVRRCRWSATPAARGNTTCVSCRHR